MVISFVRTENHVSLIFKFVCLVLLLLHTFLSAEVNITAGIDGGKGYENMPLNGTISISHNKSDIVDLDSFQFEGKPLKVEMIKEVPVNTQGTYIISIYHFEMPGKEAGLYFLPEIKVKVGQQEYRTVSSTYEITSSTSRKKSYPSQNTEILGNIELKLEAKIDAPAILYPQQYFSFIYRFYFNGDIELTKEELPLLNGQGFKKIGDKIISNTQEGNWNIQEITQKFQAINPGEFTFPASYVEGYAYYEDPILKKKTYVKPKLHAEANPITVTVLPFPDQGKPNSFQGAVGQFTIESFLLTPSKVQVGEKMRLAIDIFSRDAFLESISPPQLQELPGIKGLFRLSNLPSVGSIKDSKKRFIVEMFPLTDSIKEIPKIAFSYFDPIVNQYETIFTDAIPIVVVPKTEKTNKEQKETNIQNDETNEIPIKNTEPVQKQNTEQIETSPIEIESIEKDVGAVNEFDSFFGTWMLLWIIPFGILAILIQIVILRVLKKREKSEKREGSNEIWSKALEQGPSSPQFYHLLNKAFIYKLFEKKIIRKPEINLEEIPNEGISGEVKALLYKFQEQKFSNVKKYSDEELLLQSRNLFNRL